MMRRSNSGMFAAVDATAPCARVVSRRDAVTAVQAGLEQFQALFERGDVAVRDLETQIQREKLEIRLRHTAHQGQHHSPARLFGLQITRQCEFIRAPDSPPNVGFPGGTERQSHRSLTAASPCNRVAERLVLAPADPDLVAGRWKILGMCLHNDLPRLLHALGRDPKSLLLARAAFTNPRSVSSLNNSHHGRSASEAC